ncbi:unnamed protein product [Schistosoma mattheei]|uniref:Uncharacterized protein n=1 Tax=Schistosoma mattheei TaxID=31246 RepID=A0A183PTQ4_9TREM|nr:unnamed protein product [Schistosoma mattheei]
MAVLRISETHWTQAEQERLDTEKILLYSGHEEENDTHTQEVALMLSKKAQNALTGWASHGSRITKTPFKTKEGITMNVIQCYAPTNKSIEDDKDQLYGKLTIQWIARIQLDDLDFTYHLALPCHTHQQVLVKTVSVAAASASVGLKTQGKNQDPEVWRREQHKHT